MILRHIARPDWPNVASLPPFHGFTWQPADAPLEVAAGLIAQGRRGYRYINVLKHPCPEWMGGGDPLMDELSAFLPPLSANGQDALFPWFGCEGERKRQMLDWRRRKAENAYGIFLRHAGPFYGFFLDQWWFQPQPWMFDPSGAPYDAFPLDGWIDYNNSISNFRAFLPTSLANGDWESPGPIYLEHAERAGQWVPALVKWHQHPDNVLSVDGQALWAVDFLRTMHQQFPHKWVAIAGPNEEANSAAYVSLSL